MTLIPSWPRLLRASIVLVGVSVCWAPVSGRARREEDAGLLDKVLDAVKLGLGFFAQDYSSINVDGLFGLRLGQGQIIQALEECSGSSTCPARVQDELRELKDKIERAAAAAMGYVRADDPDYFERFEQAVSQPYLLKYTPQKLANLDKTPAGSDESYDEEVGDACFARTMGTYKEGGKKVNRCNVTRSCWNMMTQPDRSRYSITHQLLFLIIIEKTDCVASVEENLGVRLQEFRDRECGAIYNEGQKESKDGDVNEMTQDLFLEQTLVCGCLGYEDFMRHDWMRMVLRWQMPSGCFSLHHKTLLAMEQEVSIFREQERKLMKDLEWEAKMIEEQQQQPRHHSRTLLREKVMKDGCLSHKSGLGFGTLCLYLRYLIHHVYLPH